MLVNGMVVYRYQLAAFFFIAPYFTTFSHAQQKKMKQQHELKISWKKSASFTHLTIYRDSIFMLLLEELCQSD